MNTPEFVVPVEEIPPPKVDLDRITRDGYIKLKFNQKMVPPAFDKSRRRQLLSADQLNVQRDVLDISFKLFSEQKLSDIRYSLDLVSWTDERMEVYINFTEPQLVSQGQLSD
mmetsp:Transcript_27557/g.41856  ORF Transcript_27557/g.41856 Transcript_27557/m.41856 type:complete len:112 (-) Transcript_27557:1939-2274(-)